MRIVSDELWERVKLRQAEQARTTGKRVASGMSKAAAIRTGTGGKFLLSGVLRCGHCGSAYAIAGVARYACSGHTNGGNALCANSAMLRRQVAEAEVLAGINRDLCSPEVITEICHRVRAALHCPKLSAADRDTWQQQCSELQGLIQVCMVAGAGFVAYLRVHLK
jgi:site-specific DNA recombinase